MWDKEWWCVLVTIAEGSELQWWPPVLLPGGLLPFWNCGHSTSPAEAAKDNGTHTPLMTHQETQMGGTPYRKHSTCMPNHPSIDHPTLKWSSSLELGLMTSPDTTLYEDYVYPSGFIYITTTALFLTDSGFCISTNTKHNLAMNNVA